MILETVRLLSYQNWLAVVLSYVVIGYLNRQFLDLFAGLKLAFVVTRFPEKVQVKVISN